MAQLSAVAAIMYIAGEYRHNTIFYTLVASNSRPKVLLSKLLTLILFAVTFGVIELGLSTVLTYIGAALGGNTIPTQELGMGAFIARNFFYRIGFTLYAGIITMLLRSLAAPIAIVLIAGGIEQLTGLVLKEAVHYLPFRALESVLQLGLTELTSLQAVASATGYLVVGWFVALWLFIKRDAN